MPTDLGVAVVGFGWMGRVHTRAWARLLHHYPESPLRPRFVAVADPEAVRREEAVSAYGFGEAYADWRDLLARDDVDDHQLGRSWKLGESQKAGELKTLERARGSLVLVDTGTGGLTPELVPEKFRRPLREQQAAQKPAPKPPAKKKTTSG